MSFLKHLIPLKAKASLTLDKPSFFEGEPVTGKVNVDCEEYVQSTGVRIESRVYEHYSEMEWVVENNQRVPKMVSKTNTVFSNDAPIFGPSDFGQGPTRSFPFSVGIPASRPSHSGGSIEYSIKGVVAVKGRPDITAATQIAFSPPLSYATVAPPMGYAGYGPSSTNPPAGSPTGLPQYGPQPQQPMLQVRCEYCQKMMDQSVMVCPNCGARR
ncbi:hypothetical protein J2P12_02665 [Candidatus Bathyarchaeota archaeon]|nr:hypothetical protein [Candidatus Bathyarchaeota archaeon]